LGQEVFNQKINDKEATLDLSKLAAGNYIVTLEIDDFTKTIKIVKQ
jgi:hypothetical protein